MLKQAQKLFKKNATAYDQYSPQDTANLSQSGPIHLEIS